VRNSPGPGREGTLAHASDMEPGPGPTRRLLSSVARNQPWLLPEVGHELTRSDHVLFVTAGSRTQRQFPRVSIVLKFLRRPVISERYGLPEVAP
jgi:hypothetical protein